MTVQTDIPGCAVQGWVNVTGRSVLETPAGWVALGIVTVGVLIALRAVFSRRTSGVVAVLGGVIAGVGLLLLAQQAGLHGITPQSAVVWTVLPGAIGGIANAVVGAFTSAAPAGWHGRGAGAGGQGPRAHYVPPSAPATPPSMPPPPTPATPPYAPPSGPTVTPAERPAGRGRRSGCCRRRHGVRGHGRGSWRRGFGRH